MSNNNFTLIIKHALGVLNLFLEDCSNVTLVFRERENIAIKEKLSLLTRSTASFRHVRRFLRL